MGFKAKHMDGTNYWHAETTGEGLDNCCGGAGVLHCYCGGDQCVCGNFGEVECDGCEDCDYGREDGDEDDYGDEDDTPEAVEEFMEAQGLPGRLNVLPGMREWAKANGVI